MILARTGFYGAIGRFFSLYFLMIKNHRVNIGWAVLLSACLLACGGGSSAPVAPADPPGAVALCHRDSPTAEPVRIIDVDETSALAHRAHGDLAATPELQTPSGPMRGCIGEDGIARFLGVPYAQPPVASKRWVAPQALAPTNSVFDAVAYGPRCPQTGFIEGLTGEVGDEDCLQLNLFMPATAIEGNASLPVILWLHGGFNQYGSAVQRSQFPDRDRTYDGAALVSREVILVTLNYRLGALGFLALNALEAGAGNLGLLDQRAAMEWVRDNIAALGGDPERITLAGASAGGIDVCAHMAMAGSRGLFQQAIVQSGPCNAEPLAGRLAQSRRLAEAVGCCTAGCPEDEAQPQAVRACLTEVPADALVSALPGIRSLETNWYPTIDGVHLDDLPAARFFSRQFDSGIRVIFGTQDTEGAYFMPNGDLAGMVEEPGCAAFACGVERSAGRCDYSDYVCRLVGAASNDSYATRARDAYCQSPQGCGSPGRGSEFGPPFEPYFGESLCAEGQTGPDCITGPAYAAAEVVTDLFTCATQLAARAITSGQDGNGATYLYHFEPEPPAVNRFGLDLGATHGMEVAWLFQRSSFVTAWPPDSSEAEAHHALSDLMIDSWAAFATTGEPDGFTVWPRYSELSARGYRVLSLNPGSGNFLKSGRCGFWDEALLVPRFSP